MNWSATLYRTANRKYAPATYHSTAARGRSPAGGGTTAGRLLPPPPVNRLARGQVCRGGDFNEIVFADNVFIRCDAVRAGRQHRAGHYFNASILRWKRKRNGASGLNTRYPESSRARLRGPAAKRIAVHRHSVERRQIPVRC